MTTATLTSTASSRRALNVTLWAVQILLALVFAFAGFAKLTQPTSALAASMTWVTDVPTGLVRFIGAAELAGALGLLLPSLTRIRPRLTALAALGLLLVMVLAGGFHLSRGEGGMLPVNVVLAALAAFVTWGRGKAASIAARRA